MTNNKGRSVLMIIFVALLFVVVVNFVDFNSFPVISLNAFSNISIDTTSPFANGLNNNSPAARINQQLNNGISFENVSNLADTLNNAIPGNSGNNNRGNQNNNSGLLSAR